MALKFWKISETSAVGFRFTETFHLLLLRFCLPSVHKIAFANKFQLRWIVFISNLGFFLELGLLHSETKIGTGVA